MEKIYLKDINDTDFEADFIRYFRFKNTNYLIYTKNELDEKGYVLVYLVKIMQELGEKIARSVKDDIEWEGMQNIVKTVIKEIKENRADSFIDLDKNQLNGIKIVDSKYFKLDPKLVEILSFKGVLGIEKNSVFDNENEYQNDFESNISEVPNEFIENSVYQNVPIYDVNQENNLNINSNQNIINEPILNTNLNESVYNEELLNQTVDIPQINESVMNQFNIDQNIDYKSLYEQLCSEKDELENILTDTVIELTEYKIKYGELKEEM